MDIWTNCIGLGRRGKVAVPLAKPTVWSSSVGENKFKQQVDQDNECLGIGSRFLVDLASDGPVDNVLIAMEPSFGGGSGEPPPGDAHSSRDFSGSLEDFILHFCI